MIRLLTLCLFSLVALALTLGCGGSSENPVKGQENQYDIHDVNNPIPSSAPLSAGKVLPVSII